MDEHTLSLYELDRMNEEGLDTSGETEYNMDDDLYTASDDLYNEVSYSNRSASSKTITQIREVLKNGSNADVDSADTLANDFAFGRGRTNFNSDSVEHGRGKDSANGIPIDQTKSDTRRDNEQGGADYQERNYERSEFVKALYKALSLA